MLAPKPPLAYIAAPPAPERAIDELWRRFPLDWEAFGLRARVALYREARAGWALTPKRVARKPAPKPPSPRKRKAAK